MGKYNVIVIGLGLIGLRLGFDSKRKQPASHLAAITKNENLTLVGVCDPEHDSRILFKKKYGENIPAFNNHVELIKEIINDKIKLDIIVIATPDNTHREILEYLFKMLKNENHEIIIFCEKPLASNLEDACKIGKLFENSKIKIVINHVRRWSQIWQEAYQLSKEIGEIKKATYYFSTSPENKEIVQIRDGIHIADFINWFNIEKKTDMVRLMVPYFIHDFHLWGSRGKIEILNYNQTLNFYLVKKSSRFEGFKELELQFTKKLDESFTSNAYDEFVDYLDGKKISLSTNINDAITSLKVFEESVYDNKLSQHNKEEIHLE